MSLARDALIALRNISLVHDRVVALAEEVKALNEMGKDLDRRVSRLEGKFELMESMGGRAKRLPPSS